MQNELSYKMIGAALEVHKTLGSPDLLESVFESASCYELSLQGISPHRHLPVPVLYKGNIIKATEKNIPIFEAQLLTYLKLTGIK